MGGAPMKSAILGWFMPVVPEARVAILRSILSAFVLLDIHLMVSDPIPLSRDPQLYQPLLLAKALHLPEPSAPLAYGLYVILWIGCLLGIANRLPRVAGWTVAAAFTWWAAIGQSFGKVDHDHLSLVVALWLLPTVGPVAGRWRSAVQSAQAGWVLRCIQFAVIGTYFLSAVTKIRSGHWDITSWPNSAILLWAIIRRPHGLGQFLIPYPGALRVMQWVSFSAELLSPIVLWLRGRKLLFAGLLWLGFHVFTVLMLYIHFAPTVICWLAFAPLERLGPWLSRVKAWWREGAGRRTTRHPVAVAGDDAIDSTRR